MLIKITSNTNQIEQQQQQQQQHPSTRHRHKNRPSANTNETSDEVVPAPAAQQQVEITVKTLIRKEYFYGISNGEKTEEYREVKEFWTKQLVNGDGSFKNVTSLELTNGGYFGDKFPRLLVEVVGLERIDNLVHEFFNNEPTSVYVFQLGDVLQRWNVKRQGAPPAPVVYDADAADGDGGVIEGR